MSDTQADTSTVMPVKDRAEAIGRANRALKALAEHPRVTRKQLGAARERLNDCYRLGDGPNVWQAVAAIEDSAARVHAVPRLDEQPTTAATMATGPRQPPVSRCTED
jgi:hypothetical protein